MSQPEITRPCPWCGSRRLYTRGSDYWIGEQEAKTVACSDCHAQSRIGADEAQAIEIFNQGPMHTNPPTQEQTDG